MRQWTLIFRSGIALIFNQRELQSKAPARLKKVHECANHDSLRESYENLFVYKIKIDNNIDKPESKSQVHAQPQPIKKSNKIRKSKFGLWAVFKILWA